MMIKGRDFIEILACHWEFEAKRYEGMNRIHLKFNSVGFAVIDMNVDTYHLVTREIYLKQLNILGYELTDNIGPNHAIIRNISYKDTDILYKLIGYIGSLDDQFKTTIRQVSVDDVKASENEEYKIKEIVDSILTDDSHQEVEYEYVAKPEERKEVVKNGSGGGTGSYPREARKRVNALIRAGYTCEINSEHTSFISRKTGKPYMETHHLIPLEYWESFDKNLDVEANIVCLCSNCHNEIHYGKYSAELIRPLYEKRKDELHSAGIDIDIDSLIEMYEGDYIKNK